MIYFTNSQLRNLTYREHFGGVTRPQKYYSVKETKNFNALAPFRILGSQGMMVLRLSTSKGMFFHVYQTL